MNNKIIKQVLEDYKIFDEVLLDTMNYKISFFDSETSHIKHIYETRLSSAKLQKLDSSIWNPWDNILKNMKGYKETQIRTTLIRPTQGLIGFHFAILTNPAMSIVLGAFKNYTDKESIFG